MSKDWPVTTEQWNEDRHEESRADAERWKANAQSGWAGLHLIREALSEWCKPGTLPSSEYADGPTQQHEAEQLISAISALKNDNDRLRTERDEAVETIKEIRSSHAGYTWRGGSEDAAEIMKRQNREIRRMDGIARTFLSRMEGKSDG